MSQQGVLSVNSSSSRDIEFIQGNTGASVGPDAFYTINLLGSGNISVAGTPGSNLLTISDSSGFSATTSTTDDTPTEITRFTFENDSSKIIQAKLIGVQGSYTYMYASEFVLSGRKKSTNNAVRVGVPIIRSMQDFESGIVKFTTSIESGTHLAINVVGLSSTNINWKIQGNILEL